MSPQTRPDPVHELRCPSCGAYDVRPSYPKPMADAVMRLFSMAPFKCRRCNRRFYEEVDGRPARSEGPASGA